MSPRTEVNCCGRAARRMKKDPHRVFSQSGSRVVCLNRQCVWYSRYCIQTQKQPTFTRPPRSREIAVLKVFACKVSALQACLLAYVSQARASESSIEVQLINSCSPMHVRTDFGTAVYLTSPETAESFVAPLCTYYKQSYESDHLKT